MHDNTTKLRNKHDLPCPDADCGGTTSASLYLEEGDPRVHCNKCAKTWFDEDVVEEWTTMNVSNNVVSPFGAQPTEKKDKHFPARGVVSSLEERKIKQSTAEKYRVEKLFNAEGAGYAFAFPFDDSETGELVAQKVKRFDKAMKCVGTLNKAEMFGMKAFPKGGKNLTITEGEEDAMAVHQMMMDNYNGANKDTFMMAAISVKNGVAGAVKDCKANYEYIDSFDNIVLSFDGDDVGKEAAAKVAQLFPHKVKIMSFPDTKKNKETGKYEFKDACDYLKNNKQKEFMSLWWKAEKYVPHGVRTFRSLWTDMTEKNTNAVVPFPWDGVNDMCHGMVTGKMDVFKAYPKIGKTTVMSELVMHIRDTSEHNVGVIFLENTTKEIGLKFCGIRMNEPIDRPEYEEKIDWKELAKIHSDVSDDDRITIFDPSDERTAENVMKKIMYFVKAHDCKYVFLDHASMLAYSSESMDERKFLDKLFADLKNLTTSLGIYLGVVIHVNDDGKTRGSRAPVQLCDRLYSLQRDKLNSDPVIANTTEFIVEENRWGGSGLASKLLYDKDTGRMTELDMDLVGDTERKVTFDD